VGRLGQLIRRGEATAGYLSGIGRYWFEVAVSEAMVLR
jgi:hypothetical protein